jgi:hypothetical protein
MLKRELDDVTEQIDQPLTQDVPALNHSLKSKGQQPIASPPARVGANNATPGAGAITSLPADFRLCQ